MALDQHRRLRHEPAAEPDLLHSAKWRDRDDNTVADCLRGLSLWNVLDQLQYW
jgi:hypothetical protein